ncbi:MAG: MBL fold metallo-hydrolase [Anaerolineales bacterium]|nr:MBL fold metallo-hydrolase [Anaerolineales bacterium]
MYLEQYFIQGLGCASYIVGCEGEGVAAVVDPDRDIQKYLDTAAARGLTITHIIETHLHADHISGNTELAQRTGASIYVHEAGEVEFEHHTLTDGDELALGNIRLHVIHTPGHTPESITLLVSDTTRADTPWMALTGDTLFVGDIGRPDLVGVEAARQLAGDMHDSLHHKLLPLHDGLMIYPGHGAGSLCGRSIGSVRSSTLGYERHNNDALQPREREDFIEYATHNLPEQPGNHKRIKATNRRGPRPLGVVEPKPMTVQASIPYFQRGAALLDMRTKDAYIEKHIPGSVHLDADDQISNRIGFILSPDVPVVLMLDTPDQYREVVYSLARVGYEQVVGYLADDLSVWEAMGLPVTSGDVKDVTAMELHELLQNNGSSPLVIDVREPWEYAQGHIPGALLMPLGEFQRRFHELQNEKPIAVVCATGARSQTAAALLGQQGFKKVYNLVGGTSGWMMKRLPIER